MGEANFSIQSSPVEYSWLNNVELFQPLDQHLAQAKQVWGGSVPEFSGRCGGIARRSQKHAQVVPVFSASSSLAKILPKLQVLWFSMQFAHH